MPHGFREVRVRCFLFSEVYVSGSALNVDGQYTCASPADELVNLVDVETRTVCSFWKVVSQPLQAMEAYPFQLDPTARVERRYKLQLVRKPDIILPIGWLADFFIAL